RRVSRDIASVLARRVADAQPILRFIFLWLDLLLLLQHRLRWLRQHLAIVEFALRGLVIVHPSGRPVVELLRHGEQRRAGVRISRRMRQREALRGGLLQLVLSLRHSAYAFTTVPNVTSTSAVSAIERAGTLPCHGNRHCDGRHKWVDLVNLAVDFA